MQGVAPLACTLPGGQIIGLCPSLPPFPAAVGGPSKERGQSTTVHPEAMEFLIPCDVTRASQKLHKTEVMPGRILSPLACFVIICYTFLRHRKASLLEPVAPSEVSLTIIPLTVQPAKK
jgi:hypothetical protein